MRWGAGPWALSQGPVRWSGEAKAPPPPQVHPWHLGNPLSPLQPHARPRSPVQGWGRGGGACDGGESPTGLDHPTRPALVGVHVWGPKADKGTKRLSHAVRWEGWGLPGPGPLLWALIQSLGGVCSLSRLGCRPGLGPLLGGGRCHRTPCSAPALSCGGMKLGVFARVWGWG